MPQDLITGLEPRLGVAGRIAYSLLPLRQDVVDSNIRRAFPSLTDGQVERMAAAFYAHFFRTLREFFTLPFLSRETRAAMVRVENPEVFFKALEGGRGILMLGGHLGNWELALSGAILHYPEMRGLVHLVRRPFKPAWVASMLIRRFERAGIGVIAKKQSLHHILALLAANHSVGLVMDQHAAAKEGVLVNFFGSPAWTFKSLAVIAHRSGAPVIPVAVWREPDGHHVFYLGEPIPAISCADPGERIRANTQLYNDALERMIVRHPDQWIWNHRRWKQNG